MASIQKTETGLYIVKGIFYKKVEKINVYKTEKEMLKTLSLQQKIKYKLNKRKNENRSI